MFAADRYTIMMKITIIDLVSETSDIFNSKSDAARFINVHVNTLSNWKRCSDIKYQGNYIVCFNTSIHKAKGKTRNNKFVTL